MSAPSVSSLTLTFTFTFTLTLLCAARSYVSARPSSALSLGGLFELGALSAPERSASEVERLPWRARESNALYPARAELTFKLRRAQWEGSARVRLYSAPYWADSPQADSYADPLGSGPMLSELWLSLEALSNDHLALSAGGGRWVPRAALQLRPERLLASERLWSSAPHPRDRAVTGVFLELTPRAARSAAWRAITPHQVRLSLFAPSARWRPEAEELKGHLSATAAWRAPQSSFLIEGGSAADSPLSWARLSLELMSAGLPLSAQARQLNQRGWRYTGAFLYRLGSRAQSARVEALDAQVGLFGAGLSSSHRLTREEGRLSASLEYAWRDPQLDFAYNAQHILSIQCSFAILSRLSVRLEHQHLWSARDNRLSYGSDLTFAQLSWSPEWTL